MQGSAVLFSLSLSLCTISSLYYLWGMPFVRRSLCRSVLRYIYAIPQPELDCSAVLAQVYFLFTYSYAKCHRSWNSNRLSLLTFSYAGLVVWRELAASRNSVRYVLRYCLRTLFFVTPTFHGLQQVEVSVYAVTVVDSLPMKGGSEWWPNRVMYHSHCCIGCASAATQPYTHYHRL